MSDKYWLVKCEFPDDDKYAYVLNNGIMGNTPKQFNTYEDADKYAKENLNGLFYEILEKDM